MKEKKYMIKLYSTGRNMYCRVVAYSVNEAIEKAKARCAMPEANVEVLEVKNIYED